MTLATYSGQLKNFSCMTMSLYSIESKAPLISIKTKVYLPLSMLESTEDIISFSASSHELPSLNPSWKLCSNLLFSEKYTNLLTNSFSKNFFNVGSKQIRWYDLGSEAIFSCLRKYAISPTRRISGKYLKLKHKLTQLVIIFRMELKVSLRKLKSIWSGPNDFFLFCKI